MAAYITLDDVKPRLTGYSSLKRSTTDPASAGDTPLVDATGFPTRYNSVVTSIINSVCEAVSVRLDLELNGPTGLKRLIWSDGDQDLFIRRARKVTAVAEQDNTEDGAEVAASEYLTLPMAGSRDIKGLRRIRRLERRWDEGEYWVTADWGFSIAEVPDDIKDGTIDQVHFEFSLLGAVGGSTMVQHKGAGVEFASYKWSPIMFGTMMYRMSPEGKI